jgi:NADH:ubiquinone oxidoreductase subunit 4 (subunit M)
MIVAYSSVTHINLVLYSLSLIRISLCNGRYITSLAHGYISVLLFFIVGNVYFFSGTRIIFLNTGIFNTSITVGFLFCLSILSNAGIPPILSFFGELILFSSLFNIFTILFFFLFFYFLFSFYYSVYLIIHLSKQNKTLFLRNYLRYPCLIGLFIIIFIILYF